MRSRGHRALFLAMEDVLDRRTKNGGDSGLQRRLKADKTTLGLANRLLGHADQIGQVGLAERPTSAKRFQW